MSLDNVSTLSPDSVFMGNGYLFKEIPCPMPSPEPGRMWISGSLDDIVKHVRHLLHEAALLKDFPEGHSFVGSEHELVIRQTRAVRELNNNSLWIIAKLSEALRISELKEQPHHEP